MITQEEKQLLLQDLCARLPYGVKTTNGNGILELSPRTDVIYIVDNRYIPYLRPMSSITDDEKKEYKEYFKSIEGQLIGLQGRVNWSIDWLNAHHIDHHGLIEKGLALEAPKEMYK